MRQSPYFNFEALLSLRGVIGAALAYGAINAALTLAAGPALALDEVKLNVLTQSLQGGYLPDNPPLFEWSLFAAQALLGPTLASFVAVKTLFLIATVAFTFLAAREASGDARTGAVAALALPLIPQFGWSFHQTLTHSTALFAATALFWYALLRLERRNGARDFALLGLAIGAGFLAKYSFLAAAVAALIAAMAHAPLRRKILTPQAALAVLTAAAVAAPHLLWAQANDIGAAALVQERLTAESAHLRRAIDGLSSILLAAVAFLAPPAIVAALTARSATLRRGPLSDAALLSVAGLLAAALALGISNFQERYAIPFLYPAYLWLIVTACGAADVARSWRLIGAASFAVAAVFASARAVEIAAPGPPFCDECRQHIPYAYLRSALERLEAHEASLVGFEDNTAGNLRRMFPSARVISAHQPFYTPPTAGAAGACYFIWSPDLAPPLPEAVSAQFDQARILRAGGDWRRRMRGEATLRKTTWSIAAVDRTTPFGADLCRD